MPCSPPDQVTPVMVAGAAVQDPDRRAVGALHLGDLAARRFENTSVSSACEYWMLFRWQAPVADPVRGLRVDDRLDRAAGRALLDVVAAVRAVGVERDGLVGQDRQLVVHAR